MALTQLAISSKKGGVVEKFLTDAETGHTLWKSFKKKHSPFAEEEAIETLVGDADLGGTAVAMLSKNGDCVNNTLLRITLPDISKFAATTESGTVPQKIGWISGAPLAAIDRITLEIGGTKIESWTGIDIFHFYQLSVPAEKKGALFRAMGFDDVAKECKPGTYYIPIPFASSLHSGHAIPLVALTKHDVRITIEFRPYTYLLTSDQQLLSVIEPSTGKRPSIAVQLTTNRVFLSNTERQKMATSRLEYLIPTTTVTDFPLTADMPQRKLSLGAIQNPTRSLIVTYSNPREGDTVAGNDWFGAATTAQIDPIKYMKVSLNGADITQNHPGVYWRLLSTYEHWPAPPVDKKMYTVNFALNPSDPVQPSGALAFGRADSSHLHVDFEPVVQTGSRLRVLALCWSLLVVQDGLGALSL